MKVLDYNAGIDQASRRWFPYHSVQLIQKLKACKAEEAVKHPVFFLLHYLWLLEDSLYTVTIVLLWF